MLFLGKIFACSSEYKHRVKELSVHLDPSRSSSHAHDVFTGRYKGLGGDSLKMRQEVQGGVWQLEQGQRAKGVPESVVGPNSVQQTQLWVSVFIGGIFTSCKTTLTLNSLEALVTLNLTHFTF